LGDAEYRVFEHGRPCVVVCLSGTLHVSCGGARMNLGKFDACLMRRPHLQAKEIVVRGDSSSAFGIVIEL
jgi:hypothetical protein